MSGHDDTSPPAARTGADQARQRLSRRSVLRGAAGAGVAGIAATALAGTAGRAAAARAGAGVAGIAATALAGTAAPALAAAARPAVPAARGAEAGTTDAETAEQIVVHLRDARSGEIDVFRGTSQTRVHDPELAARLARASR